MEWETVLVADDDSDGMKAGYYPGWEQGILSSSDSEYIHDYDPNWWEKALAS